MAQTGQVETNLKLDVHVQIELPARLAVLALSLLGSLIVKLIS
jgi:hypothetical protein